MAESNKTDQSDDILLVFLRAGDRKSFETIYNRYWSKLYLSAYNILRERELCADVVQEVFVDLWLRRERIQVASLHSYLYSAVRYKVFTEIKRMKKPLPLSDQLPHMAVEGAIENALAEKEIKDLVAGYVQVLPERCREIFLLSRNEQLSTKEIASRLGLSPKTVENQLTIAISRLRVYLGHAISLILLFIPLLFNR